MNDPDPEFEMAKRTKSLQSLLQLWKRGQDCLNQLWSSWRNEHLLSLREKSMKGPNNRQVPTTPKINDVVLIKENLPQRVGRVIEVITGKDQQIRSAKVMVAPKKYFNRAVNMLYPIECPGDDERTSDCDIRNKIIDSELGNDKENNEKPHTDLS